MNDIELQDVKEALVDAAFNHSCWNQEKNFEGFESEAEKETWFEAMKFGWSTALFSVSDYFGNDMVRFFEDKIGHDFENLKNE